MRRLSLKPYLFIFATILFVLSISIATTAKLRGAFVAFFKPALNLMGKSEPPSSAALQRMTLENRMLKSELKRLKDHFGDDLGYIFYMDYDIIPAKVIFRAPGTWDSSLWINVGKTTNAQLGRVVVAHNSPVVVGKSVIGVIDYVGEKQSRVRLITDSGLTPSVRAVRTQGAVVHHLAKGELQGSGRPLWRTNEHLLRGIGFNYDFADEAGPARDLQGSTLPLIQVNDLLVTTGLDGVFPPGLQVAKVTKVLPLREGDYYYELEAKPTANNLDELSYIFVLKPVGYEPEDRPAGIF